MRLRTKEEGRYCKAWVRYIAGDYWGAYVVDYLGAGRERARPGHLEPWQAVVLRRCQILLMSFSTEALTTALSKESDTSSTDSTTMIHSNDSVPPTVPVWNQPYRMPSNRHTIVKTIETLKKRSKTRAFFMRFARSKEPGARQPDGGGED